MATVVLDAQYADRRLTAAEWASNNIILPNGVEGY